MRPKTQGIQHKRKGNSQDNDKSKSQDISTAGLEADRD